MPNSPLTMWNTYFIKSHRYRMQMKGKNEKEKFTSKSERALKVN